MTTRFFSPWLAVSLLALLLLAGTVAFSLLAGAGRSSPEAPSVLTIQADGEEDTLRRLIAGFVSGHPAFEVRLEIMSAALLSHSVVSSPASGHGPDVVISGAVDRQVKLVNDGYAIAHNSSVVERLPGWVQWRRELFGFTYEPVVIAYNPKLVRPDEMASSRYQLTLLLEEKNERFRKRVITNHIGLDGLGYVFATFDSHASPLYWRLLRSLGAIEAQLSPDAGSMLDALGRGDAAIGYSLARSESVLEKAERYGLTLTEPDDYRVALLRTMMIPRTARNPAGAHAFVDFVLSSQGQALIGKTALFPHTEQGPQHEADLSANVVPLGPAALVFLDERKRMRFMDTWLELLVSP